MNSRAVVMSQSERENHSRIAREQKSHSKYCRSSSGSWPDHKEMSRMMAKIFRRWSTEIVRPSSSRTSTRRGRFCSTKRLMSVSGFRTSFPSSSFSIFAVTTIRFLLVNMNVHRNIHAVRLHISHQEIIALCFR